MMETLSSISGHGRFLSWFRNFREGREHRRKKEGGGCDGKERKRRREARVWEEGSVTTPDPEVYLASMRY